MKGESNVNGSDLGAPHKIGQVRLQAATAITTFYVRFVMYPLDHREQRTKYLAGVLLSQNRGFILRMAPSELRSHVAVRSTVVEHVDAMQAGIVARGIGTKLSRRKGYSYAVEEREGKSVD